MGSYRKGYFPPKRGRPSATVKPQVAPKYQDPKTGKTWSGRGLTPDWIKGKNRDRLLIKGRAPLGACNT
ncbi:H-NS family nucleoid-associated regulatory protein [Paraburkholderia madseniana]|uniref:H-NS histone family protein n=1 Tax=Paraburkholderia madseniana TaxID=2599607 RepID=UPI0039C930E2